MEDRDKVMDTLNQALTISQRRETDAFQAYVRSVKESQRAWTQLQNQRKRVKSLRNEIDRRVEHMEATAQ